jgi:hypothetical protein
MVTWLSFFNFWFDFNRKRLLTLSVTIIICAISVEVIKHFALQTLLKYTIAVLVFLISIISITNVLGVLLRRVAYVIKFKKVAEAFDLALILFSYLFVIIAFANIYLSCEEIIGKEVFRYSEFRTHIRLLDNIYISGITITTVGYGDIIPIFWFTKLLVVAEAIIGSGLTATVLGFFIGSFLGRQQQDRQARWFASLQERYLDSLNKYAEVIKSIKGLDEEEYIDLQRDLLNTVATLVTIQYEPVPTAKVSANWMRLYPGQTAPDDAIRAAQDFVHPGFRNKEAMKTLWGILVLREWNEKPLNMPGRGELALPVYDPEDADQLKMQLHGAPQAVANAEGYIVVSDSTRLDFSNHEESIKRKFESYFQDHAEELRSFASVRMEYDKKIWGVINVQSSETELCGTTPDIQRIVVDMVRPFATYLAQAEASWETRAAQPHENEGVKNSQP